MVQNPKGGGLSSSFGASNQVVGGVKKTGDFLDKSTWTLATLLVVLILLSNVAVKGNFSGNDSKLLNGAPVETKTEQAQPVAPATKLETPQDSAE
ncbi:preprotein translocase subunit SecG [Arenibacter nanhaiticus]|uniref:Protein-export membrane protein SecG n=2 Tax=Flavobacteriaceae TaxID=49546 RepID=A0A1M6F983_9FLAO|nr:preprotein translocase subunit SecG [Arenibacter nanhaiticus]